MATTRVQWSNPLNTSKKTIINHRDHDVLQKWVTHAPSPLEVVAQLARTSFIFPACTWCAMSCLQHVNLRQRTRTMRSTFEAALPSQNDCLILYAGVTFWVHLYRRQKSCCWCGCFVTRRTMTTFSRRPFCRCPFCCPPFPCWISYSPSLVIYPCFIIVMIYSLTLQSHYPSLNLNTRSVLALPLSYVMCTADCWWSHVLIDYTTIHNNTGGCFGGGFFGATTQQ